MNRKIVVKKVRRSSGNVNQFDRECWKKSGHEARFKASWEMVSEVFLIR